MTSVAGVPAGMLVGRAIATEGYPAFLTGPQMDPAGADLHAFLALAPLRLLDSTDRVDV